MISIKDYIIIGAGPAGLQLGLFLQAKGLDYLILERSNVPGNFFQTFPRHRTLISINKRYTGYDDPEVNMRWDWNSLLSDDPELRLTKYTKKYFPDADVLVQYLNDFRQKFNLNVQFNANVKKVSKDENFKIELANGEILYAKRLIVATGMFKPYVPDIPGIETIEQYVDMSINAEDFENQRVLLIGKGNSAFETADHLVQDASLIHLASPNPIQMAWRTHFVGHLRAVNNNILDTYQLKSQNALVNAYISSIKHKDNQYHVTYAYTLASDETETLVYDRVIGCTGFTFDHSIFDSTCKPKLTINDRLPAMTAYYESENIQDLYYAGVLMQMRDYKVEQSAFIHGFRYNVKFLADYLAYHYHQQQLPHQTLAKDAKTLSEHVIREVNRTSALWQQTGYLCDVIAVDEKQCRYYSGIPADSIASNIFATNEYFTVTLEFGQKRINEYANVFAIDRIHKDDYTRADLSTGIHPIVRYYKGHQLQSTHHIIEDFDSVWAEDVHLMPLQTYFKKLFATKHSREAEQKLQPA